MPQNKSVIFHGITFKNFISSLSTLLDNIMIITCSNGLLFSDSEIKHGFELLDKSLIEQLKDDDISGDFCFIDYPNIELLNRLSKYEIAELLYIGHTFELLNEDVINYVNNRFIYLSHDNGFYTTIFYTDFFCFADMIVNKIELYVASKYSIYEKIPQEIKRKLAFFSDKGLFFDFDDVENGYDAFKLPLYIVGFVATFDDLLNNAYQKKTPENLNGYLVYENGLWALDWVIDDISKIQNS